VKRKDPIATRDARLIPSGSLSQLAEEAKHYRNCDLWRNATQTVFGEGSARHRKIMLIGEQPGNEEDKQGKAFVGPAGQRMDRLLAEAGVDRKKVYVANAVKHSPGIFSGALFVSRNTVANFWNHPWRRS
jgi:uracil-DNA glycosylase